MTNLPPVFPPKDSDATRHLQGSNPLSTARPSAAKAVKVGKQNTAQPAESKGIVLPPAFTPSSFQPDSNNYLSDLGSAASAPPEVKVSSVRGTVNTKRRILLFFFISLLVIVLTVVFWGFYLIHRVDSQLGRTEALSSLSSAPGTTWLLAGSDSRTGTGEVSDVEGQRSDTVILVHKAANGQASVVSLPRDAYVQIPNNSPNKLNAAFSWGGPPLLVATVEQLSGVKIDHYIQVGMVGVSQIIDGLGGINLCWDQSFNDRMTGLNWDAGCHDVDGNTALLFSRMRYADPLGDIGRTQRQRLMISQTLKKALSKDVILSPRQQITLADAGSKALTVDQETGAFDIARLALALRKASADGLQGVPPIASLGYNPGHGVGSAVLLDENRLNTFFSALREGTLSPTDFHSLF